MRVCPRHGNAMSNRRILPCNEWRLSLRASDRTAGNCLLHVDPPASERDNAPLQLSVPAFDFDILHTRWLAALDGFPQYELAPGQLLSFGQELAARLLPSPLLDRLFDGTPPSETAPLRLRLLLDSEDLAALPWELTYLDLETHFQDFLCLHPGVSLARELAQHGGALLAEEEDRLRVLIAWADPGTPTHGSLACAAVESQTVLTALQKAAAGNLVLDTLPEATPAQLQSRLRTFRPHVLHLIAHGERRASGGALVLHGGRPGRSESLYDSELARWLAAAGTSLAVVPACHSGSAGPSVAHALLNQGVPAVVGMQTALRDASAAQFAREFYGALGHSSSLEKALSCGRQALAAAGLEWWAPTLFLASGADPDRLLPGSAAATSRPVEVRPESRDASAAPAACDNLPTETLPFIGRGAERAALQRRMILRRQRLVTITAIGGMGKSALARQIGRDLLPQFADGVRLIDCAAVRSREELAGAIVAAAGLPRDARTSEERLFAELRLRRLLLVLDCFEGCRHFAGLLEDLLRAAPEVQFLITSRVLLGLPSEAEFPLAPLSLDLHASHQPADGMALFVEAAEQATACFRLTPENTPAVLQLCSLLEGIPLALLLAAGRMRYVSPEELLVQMRRHRFAALRPRGKTDLERVISDSLRLLPVRDRCLLRQLSVFAGGFTRLDAEHVCEPPDCRRLAEGMDRLRDCSLLQTENVDGQTRYRLLDTVRECLEQARLSPQARAALLRCRVRHAAYYARFAIHADQQVSAEGWEEVARGVARELGNLRAAIAFSREFQLHELLVDFADALGRSYIEAGLWTEFEALAADAEAALLRLARPETRARLLGRLGAIARLRGEEAAARKLWEECLALYEQQGATIACVDILLDLAQQAHAASDLGLAKRRLAQALRLANRLHDPDLVLTACVLRALVAQASDSPRQTERWLARVAARMPAATDSGAIIHAYINLTRIHTARRDWNRAYQTLLQLLRTALDGNRQFPAGWALLELGKTLEQLGRFKPAAVAFLAARTIHVRLDSNLRGEACAQFARFEETHSDKQAARLPPRLRGLPPHALVRKCLIPLLEETDCRAN